MGKLKAIINGWKNDYLDKKGLLPEPIKELVDSRLATCRSNVCGKLVFKVCTACGCPVKKKSKSLMETCPENMWNPQVYEYEGIMFVSVKEIPTSLWMALAVFIEDKKRPDIPDAIYYDDWVKFLELLGEIR